MNLAKESVYTLVFQIAGFVCATIAGMIIARTLGPENRGILTIALLCPYVFFIFLNPSIEIAMIYHMGKKKYDSEVFTGNAIIFICIFSLGALIFFYITFNQFKDSLYKGVEQRYLLLSMASVPFYFMLYYFSALLRGRMDVRRYNISNQLLNLSNVIFVVGFIAVWKLNVAEAVVAGISGIVLGGTYAMIRILRLTKGISFKKELTLSLIKDGGKLYIGSITAFFCLQVNFFILNYYTNPSEVGFYSLAHAIANILLLFGISLEIGLYPKVAHATMDESIKLTEVGSRQIFSITALGALVTALFAKYIVLIYGGRVFLPTVEPLLILLPGVVISTIPKALVALWYRKGWFYQLTCITVFSAVISMILNILLIPKFGAKGAATATSLTYFLFFIIELVLYMKYVKRDIKKLFILEKGDIALYSDIIAALKKQ